MVRYKLPPMQDGDSAEEKRIREAPVAQIPDQTRKDPKEAARIAKLEQEARVAKSIEKVVQQSEEAGAPRLRHEAPPESLAFKETHELPFQSAYLEGVLSQQKGGLPEVDKQTKKLSADSIAQLQMSDFLSGANRDVPDSMKAAVQEALQQRKELLDNEKELLLEHAAKEQRSQQAEEIEEKPAKRVVTDFASAYKAVPQIAVPVETDQHAKRESSQSLEVVAEDAWGGDEGTLLGSVGDGTLLASASDNVEEVPFKRETQPVLNIQASTNSAQDESFAGAEDTLLGALALDSSVVKAEDDIVNNNSEKEAKPTSETGTFMQWLGAQSVSSQANLEQPSAIFDSEEQLEESVMREAQQAKSQRITVHDSLASVTQKPVVESEELEDSDAQRILAEEVARKISIEENKVWFRTGKKNGSSGLSWNEYYIGGIVADGRVCTVHRGWHEPTNTRCIVKVLAPHLASDPSIRNCFHEEATKMAESQSDQIPKVLAHGEVESNSFLILEYTEAKSLQDIIIEKQAEDSFFTVDECISYIRQASLALSAAAELKLIHGDLQPSKILISEEGRLLITGFGMARVVAMSEMTIMGEEQRSPIYLSPEQGRGERGDARSDIYALGVVFYELLTGQRPFNAVTPNGLIQQHNFEEPPLPSSVVEDLSEEHDRICVRMLAKIPAQRYQDGQDIIHDFDAIEHGFGLDDEEPIESLSTGAHVLKTQHQENQKKNKSGMPFVVLVIIMLTICGLSYFFYWLSIN